MRINGEKPVLFIAEDDTSDAIVACNQARLNPQSKPINLKTFDGIPVSAVYSATIHQHYRVQDVLRENGITFYEGDIRLHERYLMERFVCAGVEFSGEPVAHAGYTEYRHARLKPADYDPGLKPLSIDIECDTTGELFSVGLFGCGR